MKIIVYGTMICPDTVDALELFKKNSIDVDYRDFGDKISYLKALLSKIAGNSKCPPVIARLC